jgi:multidrug resistance efflux pump
VSEPKVPSRQPDPRPARRFPPAMWLGVLLLVASFTYAGFLMRSRAQDKPVPSEPARVDPRTVAVTIAYVDVDGGVRPLYPVRLGRVVKVFAEEGKEYEQGKPLFMVNDSADRIELERARIDLEMAREKLRQARRLVEQHKKKVEAQKEAVRAAEEDVKAAQSQYERARDLLKERIGSSAGEVRSAAALVAKAKAGVRAKQAELAVTESLDPNAAVKLAELNVKDKRQQLEKAELGLRECTVRAPVKGSVLRSNVGVGQVLGASPQQPAMVFAPGGPRIVRAEVDQEFAPRVAVGQTARIQDDSTGGGEWRGKVVRLSDWFAQRRSKVLDPLQYNDVRTLEAIIEFDPQPRPQLRIGQKVRVLLESAGQ